LLEHGGIVRNRGVGNKMVRRNYSPDSWIVEATDLLYPAASTKLTALQ
jgi:hypothetical protein